MRTTLLACVSLAALTAAAAGQDPATTAVANPTVRSPFGFALPASFGTVTYSLTGSQSFVTGTDSNGLGYTTALGGNLAYLSNSSIHPFSAVYSGGFLYSANSGEAGGLFGGGSNFYQSLAFSQMYRTRRWVFLLSDAVSYSPQAPTTGLSGIAGVGDLGVQPVQTGIEPDQTVLRNYGTSVANGLNGSASWEVTAKASMQGSASWQTLRFLSGNGFDSNSYTGTVGPSYRIDGRDTVAASAYYSRFAYLGLDTTTEVTGVNLQYTRVISRRFSASLGAGPQFIHGSGIVPVPSESTVAAEASLNYTGKVTSASLSYSRGANAGSGLLAGAFSDTIGLGASRPLNRDWIVAVSGSFSRSKSLTPVAGLNYGTDTVVGGVQGSRRIGRYFSGFLSYTAIDQSVNNTAFVNAAYEQNTFSGLNHVFSAGVTYSPSPIHRGGR